MLWIIKIMQENSVKIQSVGLHVKPCTCTVKQSWSKTDAKSVVKFSQVYTIPLAKITPVAPRGNGASKSVSFGPKFTLRTAPPETENAGHTNLFIHMSIGCSIVSGGKIQ